MKQTLTILATIVALLGFSPPISAQDSPASPPANSLSSIFFRTAATKGASVAQLDSLADWANSVFVEGGRFFVVGLSSLADNDQRDERFAKVRKDQGEAKIRKDGFPVDGTILSGPGFRRGVEVFFIPPAQVADFLARKKLEDLERQVSSLSQKIQGLELSKKDDSTDGKNGHAEASRLVEEIRQAKAELERARLALELAKSEPERKWKIFLSTSVVKEEIFPVAGYARNTDHFRVGAGIGPSTDGSDFLTASLFGQWKVYGPLVLEVSTDRDFYISAIGKYHRMSYNAGAGINISNHLSVVAGYSKIDFDTEKESHDTFFVNGKIFF